MSLNATALPPLPPSPGRLPWRARLTDQWLPGLLVAVYFFFPISNAAANLLMLACCLLWLVPGRHSARWKVLRANPGAWMALGLYALMLVGMAYTTGSGDEIRQHLVKYFKLVFMAIVIGVFMTEVWQRRAWWAFTAALLFILASTWANIWVDTPWSSTQNQGWGQNHTVFKDYIAQGLMMSLLVVVALSRAIEPTASKAQRAVWGLVALLGALSITHLSEGRTGYVALAAALFMFILFALRGWYRVLFLAALLGAAGVVYQTSAPMQERVQTAIAEVRNHNLESFTSMGQRLYFASKSLELIGEKPLLGWGTGAYHGQFCRVADNETWCHFGKVHPHNQFLFIWVEHGVLGLALMLGLVLLPVAVVFPRTPARLGLAAGFSGIFIVGSLTHGSLWLSTESHLFTLMGALIFASHAQRVPDTPSSPAA